MAKPLKIIIKYYFTQIDFFEYYLTRIQKEGKKTNIHQLRLTVKNLRAMHQLFMVAGVPDEKIEPIEQILNKVFKTSGYLRELQINRHLAKEIFNDPLKKDYLHHSSELIKEQKKQILKKIAKFQTKAFAEHIHQMNSALIQISTDDAAIKIQDFLHNRSALLVKLVNRNIEEQQIHQIRKYLKEIKTFASVAKAIQFKTIKGFKTELNHIENELGVWHDLEIFRESLNEFITLHPLYTEPVLAINNALTTRQQEFTRKLPTLMAPLLQSFQKSLS